MRISYLVACRFLIVFALLGTAWIGADSISSAAEETGQPTDRPVFASPEKEPELTRGPLQRRLLGATPEEQARLEAEKQRLSSAAAAFGTDPTAIVGYHQLTYAHTTLTNNVRFDTANATLRLPVTPNWLLQVTMPYAWADQNQSNGFPLRGAGDMAMRMGGRLYTSDNISLFVGTDATFPTASERQLGTGKYTIGPGGGLAAPLARAQSLFLLVVTDNNSIGGDPSRANVHFMRVQPAINTIWSDRWWSLVAFTWDVDWNRNGKAALNVLAEVGHRLDQHWNVFAGPLVGVAGKDTPLGVDWGVQAGVRWVYMTPLISHTYFDLPKGK